MVAGRGEPLQDLWMGQHCQLGFHGAHLDQKVLAELTQALEVVLLGFVVAILLYAAHSVGETAGRTGLPAEGSIPLRISLQFHQAGLVLELLQTLFVAL